MRKFLSLLLAAVLICSTVLLPVSAEEVNEQDPLVAIQEEQISVQPRATGDQTTYHICFASDGRMLSGPGSSLYSNQYIQNNVSMQWIFEEYDLYSNSYIIRSASNSSQVLSVSSSGSLCTAAWGTSGYTQIWTVGSSYIASDANLDGIGEYYLYSSGSYPYTVSTTTSASSASDIELIIPYYISAGGTLTIDNVAIAPNMTAEIAQPTYTASMLSYQGDPWLLYSSNNTSVCTVDSYGRVTGVSLGTTTVTVTNKITRDTGTCTVHVITPTSKSVTVLYPSSSSASTYSSVFDVAVDEFYDTFLISYTYDTVSSTELEAISAPCTHNSTTICDSTCGALTSCNTVHHKSAVRLANVSPPSGTPSRDYTVRYVNHYMCVYQNGSHYAISGGLLNGTSDLVVCYNSYGQATTTTLHELSHTYGTLDNYGQMNCSSTNCVMASAARGWCSNCYNIIMNNR